MYPIVQFGDIYGMLIYKTYVCCILCMIDDTKHSAKFNC